MEVRLDFKDIAYGAYLTYTEHLSKGFYAGFFAPITFRLTYFNENSHNTFWLLAETLITGFSLVFHAYYTDGTLSLPITAYRLNSGNLMAVELSKRGSFYNFPYLLYVKDVENNSDLIVFDYRRLVSSIIKTEAGFLYSRSSVNMYAVYIGMKMRFDF